MSAVDRLEEIKETMKTLLAEAKDIVYSEAKKQGKRFIYERAKGYWLGHIATALDDDSDYVTGPGEINMQSTIDDLGGGDKGDDLDEDEDEEDEE